MGWIRVLEFDSEVNIPIMSIEDSEGLERLSILIGNKQSKRLTVRTCKATCVFESVSIPDNKWFHLVIVHQKPMLTASSVTLYINGKQLDVQKCGYLGKPGSVSSVITYFGSRKTIGDYIFQLGPIYMFEEYLLDAAVIAVAYEIGFEYSGNWQGTWEKYLVGNELLRSKAYEIADEESRSPLGQMNFMLHQEKSIVPLALNVPEEKVLFSISAANLMKKKSCSNSSTEDGSIFFNGAYQKLGVESKSRTLTFYGSILHVCSSRIVDSIWSLGGSIIILQLVEDSRVFIIS
jgi:hypothetical protein